MVTRRLVTLVILGFLSNAVTICCSFSHCFLCWSFLLQAMLHGGGKGGIGMGKTS